MARTLPFECEHGRTIDWGDFGPDPDDGSAGADWCEACDVGGRPDALRWLGSVSVDELEPADLAAIDAAVDELVKARGNWEATARRLSKQLEDAQARIAELEGVAAAKARGRR